MTIESRRKKRTRKAVIVFLVAVLVLVSLNVIQKEVKSFFYFISSPIQGAFWSWGERSSDFLIGFMKRGEIEKQKEDLKKENQKLMSEILYLQSIKKENEELKKALDLNLRKEFDLSIARIIAKNLSEDVLLIDKGENSGISSNMPVITSEKVAVGLVNAVYSDFSEVKLISHKDSRFGAEVKEVEGVIRGQGGFELLLDLIPKDKEITVGDSVVTAGIEKDFPPGLLIGRVSKVLKEDVESIQKAYLEMGFSLDRNSYLFVIKNF